MRTGMWLAAVAVLASVMVRAEPILQPSGNVNLGTGLYAVGDWLPDYPGNYASGLGWTVRRNWKGNWDYMYWLWVPAEALDTLTIETALDLRPDEILSASHDWSLGYQGTTTPGGALDVMYGLNFDVAGNSATIHFESTRAPGLGSFYVAGDGDGWDAMWSSGLTHPALTAYLDYTRVPVYLAVPGGGALEYGSSLAVPEPASGLLLAGAAAAMAGLRAWRRRA